MPLLSLLCLCLSLFLGACVQSPVGPSVASSSPTIDPIPTLAATAVPGEYTNLPMTVLGQVPCSGATSGASPFILRKASDWTAYMAAAGCDVPAGDINLSGFNFSVQSVLILQYQECAAPSLNSANIWNVYQLPGYLYARCDITTNPPNPVSTGCATMAVAIPATTEGATWTVCEQSPSYHCLDFVTP